MPDVEEFQALLKEVVQARRLSASKMAKLTEIAMKDLEHDTQLVSILYRMHKSLPISCKVSSLYVFDALARAAKHQANKQKLALDNVQSTGNAASFLAKMGGVVDGLFQDMQSPTISEGKEKTKKVLDIWIKGNTFPPELLSSLRDILKGNDQASETNLGGAHANSESTPPTQSTPTVVPQPMASPIHGQSPLVAPAADAQATLLALLAQAANAGSVVAPFPQTTVNTPGAQFASAQFVLQQLVQTAAAPALNVPSPPLVSTSTGNEFAAGPNRRSRSPIPDDPRKPQHEASRQERYMSPENGRAYDSHSDYRSFSRAPGRGSFRGRSSGDRRRWDDRNRDTPYRDRGQRDRSPRRRGRSRSRSPPRHGDRRSENLASPRRSSASPLWTSSRRPEPATTTASGKDEFGRDIRPPSPETASTSSNSAATSTPTLPNTTPSSPLPITVDITDREHSNTSVSNTHDTAEIMSADVAPITSTTSGNATPFVPNATVSANGAPQGMDTFDFSTFDLRSPASWEALGKMWQVTYGCAPTDEQLMQFVMSMGTIRPDVGEGMVQQWTLGESQGAGYPARGRGSSGRGRYGAGFAGRGRGTGYTHGNARNNWSYDDQGTDAIVLGGGDSPEQESENMVEAEAQSGGKMQKMGDKWVFIRTDT